MQTLRQLLRYRLGRGLICPAVGIPKDYPRYQRRMVKDDVSRGPIPERASEAAISRAGRAGQAFQASRWNAIQAPINLAGV